APARVHLPAPRHRAVVRPGLPALYRETIRLESLLRTRASVHEVRQVEQRRGLHGDRPVTVALARSEFPEERQRDASSEIVVSGRLRVHYEQRIAIVGILIDVKPGARLTGGDRVVADHGA